MTSLCEQIEAMERGLHRLREDVPTLPIPQFMTARLLVYLGRELSAQLDQSVRPHGLNEIEFRALMLVYNHRKSAAHPSHLCTSLAQSPANVTRLTDALVERGLISRVPDEADRRRLALKPTPAGEQLVEQLMPHLLERIEMSFQGFAPERVEPLLDLLKQLARALDEASATTAKGAGS